MYLEPGDIKRTSRHAQKYIKRDRNVGFINIMKSNRNTFKNILREVGVFNMI